MQVGRCHTFFHFLAGLKLVSTKKNSTFVTDFRVVQRSHFEAYINIQIITSTS